MMFGFIILLIITVYFIYPSDSMGACSMYNQSKTSNVLEILDERYARGEIEREDYLQRKGVLTGQKQPISLHKE